MNTISFNNTRDNNYKNTKKCAGYFAVAAAGVHSGYYGASVLSMKRTAKHPVYNERKVFISKMTDYFFKDMKLDMTKSTVSREMKKAQKSLLKPIYVVPFYTLASVIGGTVGYISDIIKNHNNNKI